MEELTDPRARQRAARRNYFFLCAGSIVFSVALVVGYIVLADA